jgi:CRISPR associated protein Cas1
MAKLILDLFAPEVMPLLDCRRARPMLLRNGVGPCRAWLEQHKPSLRELASLDPVEREASSAFVSDMMEPERPRVDRAVLDFVKANALHPADFTLRMNGVCRLNPQMAKCMIKAWRAQSS